MTPIQFETNGLTVLAVKWPEEYTAYAYNSTTIYFGSRESEIVRLPEGKWRIHTITSDITEEQAKGLVKFVGLPFGAYKDYTTTRNWHSSARRSLHSLLRSHGIDLNQKYVLLIKEI